MNSDTLKGEGRNLGGKVEEVVGKATGDQATENRGVANQVAGNLQQSLGAAKDAVAPLAGKAKTFAKERPWATAALVGTIALAVINTLRGKRP